MTEQTPPDGLITLLCLDLEAGSAALARYAHALAQRCAEQLQVLHVAPADSSAEELAQLRVRLDAMLAELSEGEALPPCEVVTGIPDTVIPEQAGVHNAARVILGRRHRSSVERFYVGSTTSAVISTAPCAVLVVPLTRKHP